MLNIPCPWCGPRNETEFRYGGQAHIAMPPSESPSSLGGPSSARPSDADWADFLFMRNNPKGWFAERWFHTQGCRRWFNAWRHTVTHAFGPSYPPGVTQPPQPTEGK